MRNIIVVTRENFRATLEEKKAVLIENEEEGTFDFISEIDGSIIKFHSNTTELGATQEPLTQ